MQPTKLRSFALLLLGLSLAASLGCSSDVSGSADAPNSMSGGANLTGASSSAGAPSGGSAPVQSGAGSSGDAKAGAAGGGFANAGSSSAGSAGAGAGGTSGGFGTAGAAEAAEAAGNSAGIGGSAHAAGAAGGGFPMSAGKPTVYLAGDSTVQTYGAAQAPQQGWGQRVQEFFTTDVVFVNKAIGGRSSKSYIDEGRLDDILESIKKGDYLFAQWGINDRYTSDAARYTDPKTTFRTYLKMYIDGARAKSAIPVLVTPTPRLDYQNGMFINDFPAYCQAIQEVGVETGTTVIDLQTRGLAYYTSIGYSMVQSVISLDVLHFKTEGARQMARLVSEGVEESNLPIAAFVK